VDLDLNAAAGARTFAADVVNAITAQNVIAPSGTIKLDRFEYQVETNSAPLWWTR
jgi:multidrug efflux pump subunit AcrB